VRAVNLLPRDDRAQRGVAGQPLPAIVGAALGVVVTGVLAIQFLGAAGDVRKAQSRLAKADQELAATPAPPAPKTDPNAQLAGEQNTRLLALSSALGGRVAWDRILREFSLVLPGDVWLSTLSMSSPGASLNASGPLNNFTMTGYTYSHDSVARLLSRLQLLPELSDVSLTSSTESQVANGPTTVQFTISASVPGPVAAAAPATPAAATTPDTTTTGTTTTDTTTTGTTGSGS
jgi:Tfp pilus assembly protein PilN